MSDNPRIIETPQTCCICDADVLSCFDAGDQSSFTICVCVNCLQRAADDIRKLETVA